MTGITALHNLVRTYQRLLHLDANARQQAKATAITDDRLSISAEAREQEGQVDGDAGGPVSPRSTRDRLP